MKSNKGNMAIKNFISPSNNNNSYLLINGDEAAVIDPADAYQDIQDELGKMGIGLKYLLVTHGHKSHFDSAPMLKKDFGGKFCLHKLDVDLLKESGYNLEPDLTVKDNDSFELNDAAIKVQHTPGHTESSICFYVKSIDALFSGDTLLKGEFGRIWGLIAWA